MRLLGRVAGLLLIGAGIGGLIFCVVGLYLGAQALGQAEAAAGRAIDKADAALLDVGDGLTIAGTSLTQAGDTIGDVRSSIGGVTQTITDTLPAIESLSSVVGEDVPETIRATQRALGSAQATALLIDGLLTTISRVGLISSQVYNPSVPLSSAIGQISTSLDGLPGTLEGMRGDFATATGNLRELQGDTARLEEDIETIGASLDDARTVVVRYQETVASLRDDLAGLRSALPGWFGAMRWGGALLLIWLGAAQLGLVTQGWELLRRS